METDKGKSSDKEKKLREQFRRVFRSKDGKAVLDYIIHGICGWDVAVFFQDARKQDYWMGQRSVAKRLMILTQDNKPTIDEKE